MADKTSVNNLSHELVDSKGNKKYVPSYEYLNHSSDFQKKYGKYSVRMKNDHTGEEAYIPVANAKKAEQGGFRIYNVRTSKPKTQAKTTQSKNVGAQNFGGGQQTTAPTQAQPTQQSASAYDGNGSLGGGVPQYKGNVDFSIPNVNLSMPQTYGKTAPKASGAKQSQATPPQQSSGDWRTKMVNDTQQMVQGTLQRTQNTINHVAGNDVPTAEDFQSGRATTDLAGNIQYVDANGNIQKLNAGLMDKRYQQAMQNAQRAHTQDMAHQAVIEDEYSKYDKHDWNTADKLALSLFRNDVEGDLDKAIASTNAEFNAQNQYNIAHPTENSNQKVISKFNDFADIQGSKVEKVEDNPDKMSADYSEALYKQLGKTLSGAKFKKNLKATAQMLGISEETYLQKFVMPKVEQKIGGKVDGAMLRRYMPKNDFEYMMRGYRNWIAPMAWNAITNNKRAQMESAADEEYGKQVSARMSKDGGKPNETYWEALGRRAGAVGTQAGRMGVEFADPAFGLTFKGAGEGVRQAERLFAKGALSRVGQRLGLDEFVSEGLKYSLKYGTAAEQKMSQLIASQMANATLKERGAAMLSNYLSNLPREVVSQALGMNAYSALQSGLQTYGSTQSISEAGSTAWQALTSPEGALSGASFAVVMPFLHGGWKALGAGWKADSKVLAKLGWGAAKGAYDTTSILATAALMQTTDNLYKAMSGEKTDWTLDTFIEKTAVSAAMKLNPTMVTQIGQALRYGSKVEDGLKLTKSETQEVLDATGTSNIADALRTIFPEYQKSGRFMVSAEDVQQAQRKYLELMNRISWDAQNKINVALTGSYTIARPRFARFDFQGSKVMELDKDGNVLSTKTFKSSDEKKAYMAEKQLNVRNTNFMEAYTNANQKNRAAVNLVIQQLADSMGIKDSDITKVIMKEPIRRTEGEWEFLDAFKELLEPIAYPKGELNVEQAEAKGREIAEEAKVDSNEPDVEKIADVSKAVDNAQAEFEQALKDASLDEPYQQLKAQGMSDEEIFERFRSEGFADNGTMDNLERLANEAKNAQGVQQGVVDGVQDKIDSDTSDFANQFQDGEVSVDDKPISGNQVVVATFADGTMKYITAGKLKSTGKEDSPYESDLPVFGTDGQDEPTPVEIKDIVSIETMNKEDAVNAFRDAKDETASANLNVDGSLDAVPEQGAEGGQPVVQGEQPQGEIPAQGGQPAPEKTEEEKQQEELQARYNKTKNTYKDLDDETLNGLVESTRKKIASTANPEENAKTMQDLKAINDIIAERKTAAEAEKEAQKQAQILADAKELGISEKDSQGKPVNEYIVSLVKKAREEGMTAEIDNANTDYEGLFIPFKDGTSVATWLGGGESDINAEPFDVFGYHPEISWEELTEAIEAYNKEKGKELIFDDGDAFGAFSQKAKDMLDFKEWYEKKAEKTAEEGDYRIEGNKVIGKYKTYDREEFEDIQTTDREQDKGDSDEERPLTEDEILNYVKEQENAMLEAVGGKIPDGLKYIGIDSYTGEGYEFEDKDGNTIIKFNSHKNGDSVMHTDKWVVGFVKAEENTPSFRYATDEFNKLQGEEFDTPEEAIKARKEFEANLPKYINEGIEYWRNLMKERLADEGVDVSFVDKISPDDLSKLEDLYEKYRSAKHNADKMEELHGEKVRRARKNDSSVAQFRHAIESSAKRAEDAKAKMDEFINKLNPDGGGDNGTEVAEPKQEDIDKAVAHMQKSKANDMVKSLATKFGWTQEYAQKVWSKASKVYQDMQDGNMKTIQEGIDQGMRFYYIYAGSKKAYRMDMGGTFYPITKEEYDWASKHGGKMMTDAEIKDREEEHEKDNLLDWFIKSYPHEDRDDVISSLEKAIASAKSDKERKMYQDNLDKIKRLDELQEGNRERQERLTSDGKAYENETPAQPEATDYKTRLEKANVTDEDIVNALGGDELLSTVKDALDKVKKGEELGPVEEGLVASLLMSKEQAHQEHVQNVKNILKKGPKAAKKEKEAKEQTHEQDKADFDSAVDDAKKALEDFFFPKGSNQTFASFVPVNPEQAKALPKLVGAIGRLGYTAIKLGAHDFASWCTQIKQSLETFFKDRLGWDDKKIDDCLTEMWEFKYKVGDETHTIKEWAEMAKKLADENATKSSQEFKAEEDKKADFRNKVADALMKPLRGEDKVFNSIRDIRELAKECGLENMRDTDLQEVVESAIVKNARDIASRTDLTSEEKFEQIKKLYESQPSLNKRDNDRIMLQQYSTPAPMAYVLDLFVNPNGKAKSGLEPSAGNGMLTIGLPKDIMHVNDIDEMRLSNLQEQGFGKVTNQDGTLSFGDKKYDLIVTNPPFGTVTPKDYDGVTLTGLEHQMAVNALNSMKDNGRAAIIIGGNTEYQSNGAIKGAKDKAFLNYLYQHYNVADVINLDGKKLYSRQGTGYDVRMILIDGRKEYDPNTYAPVEKDARAEKVSDYDELYKRVNDDILRNADKSAGVHDTEGQEGGGVHDRDDANQPSKEGVRGVSDRGRSGESEPLGKDGQRVQLSEQSTEGEREGERGRGVEATDKRGGETLDNGTPSRDGGRTESVESSGRTSEGSGRGDNGETGADNSQRHNGGTGESIGAGQRRAESKRADVQEEQRGLGTEKVPYRKQSSNPFSLNSLMPAEQADQVKSNLEEIGDVDAMVTKELGYSSVEEMHKGLAAEQVDSVAMAIHQMSQGNAFIIGDQTGIGKGRQAAAIIRYGVKKGGCPVFVTVKKGLFSDMYRDLCDIGSPELRPFVWAADDAKHSADVTDNDGNLVYKRATDKEQKRVIDYINKNGKLPPEYDYVVTTYDGFKSGTKAYENGNKVERKWKKGQTAGTQAINGQAKRDALETLAANSYIVMDESHNAGGEDSAISNFLQYIVGKSKGTTFLSATFAKRPGNMPIYSLRTAISKAGVEVNALIDAVRRGGATFQEVMSKALTGAGQMIRRERDMTGVTIDWRGIEDEAVVAKQREQYDKVIGLFNRIIDFQKQYVDPAIDNMNDQAAAVQGEVNHKKGTRDMGINNTPFASRTYNMVQQVLLSLKAEEAAKRAIEHLKEGRKAVITVANTNEKSADEAAGSAKKNKKIADDGTTEESMEMPDLSVNLKKGLQGVMRYTFTDAKGNDAHGVIPVDKLGPEAVAEYNSIINDIENASSGLSLSPIDVIKNELKKAGYNVGELTGRKSEFVYNDDGSVSRVKRTDTDKKEVARQFNNGEIDALILNKSAGTGISLHASSKFKDQRQRVMIVAQAQGDVNDEVQIRGRIDRTGQVLRGMYEYIVSQIPSEQRLLMMLKSKLRSLDANTTSSQKSKFNEMDVQDVMNKYGDQVLVQYLAEHPDLYDRMADPLKWGDSVHELSPEELVQNVAKLEDGQIASKILGRMALLKVAEQEAMLEEVGEIYAAEINRLNEMGENDLEITEMPLKAKTLAKHVWEAGSEPDGKNPFADNTYVEEVEMDVLRKPMKAKEVKGAQDAMLNGKTYDEFRVEKQNDINDWAEQKEHDIRVDFNERAQKAYDKAVEKYLKAAQKANEKAETKMSDEEMQRQAEVQANDIRSEYMEKMNKQLDALKATKHLFENALDSYTTDGVYALPADIYDLNAASAESHFGKLIDVKISKNFSPATSTLTFATLDGRRKITVPINGMVKGTDGQKHNLFEWMNTNTARIKSGVYGLNAQNTLKVIEQNADNWDRLTSTASRKKGYIVTGNLLKALVSTREQNLGGKLISYTTDTGEVKQGLLMPEKFDAGAVGSNTPISSKAENIINNEKVVSADGNISIKRGGWWSSNYELRVPKSTAKGGRYFNDKELLSCIDGQFESVGNSMRGYIEGEENLKKALSVLDRLGVKVREEKDITADSNTSEGTTRFREVEEEVTPDRMAGEENDLTPAFKNNRGTKIARIATQIKGGRLLNSGHLKIGKSMMGKLYIHKDYASRELPEEFIKEGEKYLPEGFEYNTICYDPKNPDVIRFDECPNFDTASNPRVGRQFGVNVVTGEPIYKTKDGSGIRNEQQIFHDKWQWVDNDYKGFDVKKSYDWSKEYNAKIDGTPNGRTNKWEEQLEGAGLKGKEEKILYKTSEELDKEYPGWQNQTNPKGNNEGGHSTQISSTRKTYQKVGKWMLDNGMKDAEVLDASSGLGFGTLDMRSMGLNVEDVEPFAGKGRVEAPTYTSYDQIDKQYDLVVSNAVLNVIPDDWRADVLKSMADKVKVGGKMFINCLNGVSLGKNTKILGTRANGKPNEVLTMWDADHYRSYQHIYSAKELADYVKEQLGDGWKVETAKKAGIDSSDAIMVTRETEDVPRYREVPREVLESAGSEVAESSKSSIQKHVESLGTELNENITMHNDASTITDKDAKQKIAQGKNVKGWYNTATKKVELYMPNIHSKYDAERTVVHETVGHKGLRGLFNTKSHPDNYNKFMDALWRNDSLASLHEYVKKHIARHNFDIYTSVDEWLAEETEKTVSPDKVSMWTKIKEAFTNALKTIGYMWNPNINDVRYAIWLAKRGKHNPNDPLFKAMQKAFEHKLAKEDYTYAGHRDGVYLDKAEDAKSKTLFSAPATPYGKMVADQISEYLKTRAARIREAFVDNMDSFKVLQEKITGKNFDDETMPDSENAYRAENHITSIAETQANKFKVQRFQPLDKVLGKIVGKLGMGARKGEDAVQMYAYKKSGLERNRKFFVRDGISKIQDDATRDQVQQDYDTLRHQLSADLKAKKMTYRDYLAELDDWIRTNLDPDYDPNKNDYSGISEFDPARIKKGKKVEFNEDDIIDSVMDMEDNIKQPLVDELWDTIKYCTDFGVDYGYESGLTDKETATNIKDMFDFYIPMRGHKDDAMEDVFFYPKAGDGKKTDSIFKKAWGRTSLAESPFGHIASMADSAIMEGERNKVKMKLYRMVVNNPSDAAIVSDLWEEKIVDVRDPKTGDPISYHWEVKMPDIPNDATPSEIADIVENFTRNMEAAKLNGDARIAHKRPNYPLRFNNNFNASEHAVRLQVNGRERVVYITGDPRPAMAINGKLNNQSPSKYNPLYRLMRVTAALATSYSPEFILSNTSRDTLFSNANIASKENTEYLRKFTANQLWALQLIGTGIGGDKINESLFEKYYRGHIDRSNPVEKDFADFMDNGGRTGFIAQRDIETYEKDLVKAVKSHNRNMILKGIQGTLDAIPKTIEQMNMRAELINRFACYRTSRQMGRTIQRSIADAKEISVNFNRHGAGNATKGWEGWFAGGFRNYYMFFNAGMQSMELLHRNMFKNGTHGLGHLNPANLNGKTALKTFANMGVVPFALGTAFAMALAGKDDEKYSNIPSWDRRNNICIPVEDKGYFKIPLPIELRAWWGLGDIAASLTYKRLQTEESPAFAAAGQISQMMPLDVLEAGEERFKKDTWWIPLTPTTGRPWFENMENVDWTGKPIQKSSKYFEDAPQYTLAYSSTPAPLIWVSKWIHNETREGKLTAQDTDVTGIDISPAKVEHIVKSYFSGAYSLLGKGVGLAFADEVKASRVPMVSRLWGDFTDKEVDATTNAKFFAYKREYDNTHKEYTNPLNKAKDVLGELSQSPRGKRHDTFQKVNKKLERIRKEINKEGTTPERKMILQQQEAQMKRDLVDALDAIE